jgi:hypothetical protein
LKVFTELADFLFNVFPGFDLRHSVFTYLSATKGLDSLVFIQNGLLFKVLGIAGCLPKPQFVTIKDSPIDGNTKNTRSRDSSKLSRHALLVTIPK